MSKWRFSSRLYWRNSGAGLTRKQFDEVMLAMFEHIPRFETLPRKRHVEYGNILWSRYHQILRQILLICSTVDCH